MNRHHRQWLKSFLVSGLMTPLFANAAPGTISDTPLFLTTSVEPNIFFVLDDSGSMEWETLVQGGEEGRPNIGGWTGNYYVLPSSNNGQDGAWKTFDPTCTWGGRIGCYPFVTASETADSDAWRVRNHNYNVLYYNPNVTYKPWEGVDASNNPLYSDASYPLAPVDPNNPTGDKLDLTADITFLNFDSNSGWYSDTLYPAQYYTWTDDNSNSTVDTSDSHTQVKITSTTTSYTGSANRTDCAAAPTCTYAEELQNFANWYTYHRKRGSVAKSAVGSVVDSATNARIGLQVFNGGRLLNAASIDTASNKLALQQSVYGASMPCDSTSCPGTPTRTALQSVGDLFEGNNSPILPAASGGTCQQNFSVVLSDGFWNGASPGVGNTDGDGDTTFDGAPYADTYSDTLGDVAMHYYERDLKTGLLDEVPIITGVDTASHQHLVTYSVAFGISGTLDPIVADPTSTGFAWPDPTDFLDDERVDDLWHAAYNGRGKFLSAQNPTDLTTSLEAALRSISDRTGSAAAVAFNSGQLSNSSDVYLALFNSSKWSGDLQSYPLDPNTGAVSTPKNWSAANQLDTTPYTSRNIITYDTSATTPVGIPFTWSSINTAMKDDLKVNPDGSSDTSPFTVAQARLEFIRGDRSNEGTGLNFRERDSRLGDIIHSGPVFVGGPQLAWPDGDDDLVSTTTNGWPEGDDNYSIFKNNTQSDTPTGMKDRDGVIYLGSNDGMLHGFKESDGNEVFAFIPAKLFSTSVTEGLHHLSDPAYSHRYFVDLTPTVSDVFIKSRSAPSTKKWRTVLVGAFGAGGKGIFALDVTDPSLLTETNANDIVLWEFTDADHANLGNTFSRPVIAPTYATDANGHYRWAAIFGNGYNNTGDGKSSLFVLFLDGGLDGTWTPGTDYVVLTTPSGSLADNNGMSSPAIVDLDSDYVVDTVYAGDLHGNMWAFNLTDPNPSNWEIIHGNSNTDPLFTATDSSSNRQPITTLPQVAKNPNVADANNNQPNVLVMFGTGQYLATGDASNTDTQTFYAVWDNDDGNNATGLKTRANLQPQYIEQETTILGKDIRLLSDNTVDWATKEGWYLDFLSDSDGDGATEQLGERLVTSPLLRGDIIFFNTTVPSSNPCSAGGSGWQMSLDIANGGRPDDAIFDLNNDGVVDANDLYDHDSSSTTAAVAPGGERFNQGMPAAPAFLGNKQYTPGTKTTTGDQISQRDIQDLGGYKTGRLSWQQLQ